MLAFPPCTAVRYHLCFLSDTQDTFPSLTPIIFQGSLVKGDATCQSIFLLPIYVFPHVAYNTSLSLCSSKSTKTSNFPWLENADTKHYPLIPIRLEKTSKGRLSLGDAWQWVHTTRVTQWAHTTVTKRREGTGHVSVPQYQTPWEKALLCVIVATPKKGCLNTMGRLSDCRMPTMPFHLSYIMAAWNKNRQRTMKESQHSKGQNTAGSPTLIKPCVHRGGCWAAVMPAPSYRPCCTQSQALLRLTQPLLTKPCLPLPPSPSTRALLAPTALGTTAAWLRASAPYRCLPPGLTPSPHAPSRPGPAPGRAPVPHRYPGPARSLVPGPGPGPRWAPG